ncbi:hypothetical protein ACQP2X_04480 [Actinoplanes sp. CA-131856]
MRLTASGAHDPKAHKLTRAVSLSGGRPGQSIVIGADTYSRVDGEGSWIHADIDTVTSGVLLMQSDVDDSNSLARFAENVTLIERAGPHAYKGFFRWVDFTATTDVRGAITSIGIAVEAKERRAPSGRPPGSPPTARRCRSPSRRRSRARLLEIRLTIP